MDGTFKKGDFLCLDETKISDINVGDVIVFSQFVKDDERKVVHRVVAKKKDGSLVTRGDNSLDYDFLAVREAEFIGRVTSFFRWNKKKKVFNYWNCRFLVAHIRRKVQLKILVKATLRPLYIYLRDMGVVSCIWHPAIRKIRQIGPNGISLDKYIYNGKTVASFDHESLAFTCDKPFDLVIRSPKTGLGK